MRLSQHPRDWRDDPVPWLQLGIIIGLVLFAGLAAWMWMK